MSENKKPKVLIIDDEPAMLDIYSANLTDAEMEVIIASNGEEGVKLAAEHHPDLILMDVKMPVMNGVEAAMKLKDNPETRDLKVVFLSAFGDPAAIEIDQKFAKEIGARDFLQKGTSFKEFVKKVKSYL